MRKSELRIPSELSSVPAVASSVRELCLEHGVTDTEAAEIETAAVEAVNNAIQHAYGLRAGHEVHFSVEVTDSSVVMRVRDTGRPMPPGLLDAVPEELGFDPEIVSSLPTHGMGLVLMKLTMDDVQYQTSGGENTLLLTRHLSAGKPRGERP